MRVDRILVPSNLDRGNPYSVGIRESVRVNIIIAFDSFAEKLVWLGHTNLELANVKPKLNAPLESSGVMSNISLPKKLLISTSPR
jgi:hypothetical protein